MCVCWRLRHLLNILFSVCIIYTPIYIFLDLFLCEVIMTTLISAHAKNKYGATVNTRAPQFEWKIQENSVAFLFRNRKRRRRANGTYHRARRIKEKNVIHQIQLATCLSLCAIVCFLFSFFFLLLGEKSFDPEILSFLFSMPFLFIIMFMRTMANCVRLNPEKNRKRFLFSFEKLIFSLARIKKERKAVYARIKCLDK